MDAALTSPLGIFTWTFVGTAFIAILFGNGLIIAVNGKQWLQNRKMVPSDFLLTNLSIFRLLSYLTFILGHVLEVTPGDSYIYIFTKEVINFTSIFSVHISLWCASWLSVLYCVKVTNFANHFFLWLKPRINVLSIRLLGISISSLMIFSIPFFNSYTGHKKVCNMTRNLSVNVSQNQICKNLFVTFRLFQIIFASINFTISVTASIVLILSLWKHIRNLKKSGVGIKDLTTQMHIRVIKTLLLYIFFYSLYFAGMILFSSNTFLNETRIELLSDILMTIFPSAHTIIIVLTNPKLKTVVAHILDIRKMAS
ncbi:taste receptor type 2 member 7-like [Sceloporus undulatus]|uniref:taste receptor type 2 member 7-like n=1 Tax=Sceloporus undulatus TaxID=8520 RepID=UPI001C4B9390|nr:taste receptor type 2 member 7-like [Sceloporus undulatus]